MWFRKTEIKCDYCGQVDEYSHWTTYHTYEHCGLYLNLCLVCGFGFNPKKMSIVDYINSSPLRKEKCDKNV